MDSNLQNEKQLTATQVPDLTFNLLDVIASVWRWRKRILILAAIVTLGTVVVSLFLPNYYTATSTFVPANEEKDLFGKEGKNNGMYGDEDAVDRAIIFAGSTSLVNFMIQEFKLAERYKINASTPKGESKVSKRFLKLYNLKKNEHGGIEISMQDTDPAMAAKMLTAAITKIDEIYKYATAPNKDMMMQTYEGALAAKRSELKTIGDSLFALRKKYNVFDVEIQGELLATLLVETESQLAESSAKLESFRATGGRPDSIINLSAKVQGLTRRLQILNSKTDTVNSSINLNAYNEARELIMYYDSQTESINEDIGEILKEYTRFKAQANSKAGSLIVLEPVQTPKIKSYPVRSLMVIAALFLSLIVGIMGALVLDLNSRIDWKTILKN